MKGHGSKLNRKMEAAINALLTQKNHEDAARTAGISVATLRRWLKLPEFHKALLEAQRAAFNQAGARLQYASSAAASTLLKVLLDPTTPASTKVRAADSVLAYACKHLEAEDILTRLEDLEASAGNSES